MSKNSGCGLKRLSINTAVPSLVTSLDAFFVFSKRLWKAWSTSVWLSHVLLKAKPLKSCRWVSPRAPTAKAAKATDTLTGEKKMFLPCESGLAAKLLYSLKANSLLAAATSERLSVLLSAEVSCSFWFGPMSFPTWPLATQMIMDKIQTHRVAFILVNKDRSRRQRASWSVFFLLLCNHLCLNTHQPQRWGNWA